MSDFAEGMLAYLKASLVQEECDDGVKVTLPFLDSHNDMIQYYVRKVGGGYQLSDDGYVLSDLKSCGCDVETDERQALIRQIIGAVGVELLEGCIVANTGEQTLAEVQFDFVQALLKVSDMYLTSATYVKKIYKEDLAKNQVSK